METFEEGAYSRWPAFDFARAEQLESMAAGGTLLWPEDRTLAFDYGAEVDNEDA